MIREIRACVVCGNKFQPVARTQIYCGKVCAKKGDREIKRKRELAKKEEKKKSNALIDIAVAARREGLSYGQYVAKYGV